MHLVLRLLRNSKSGVGWTSIAFSLITQKLFMVETLLSYVRNNLYKTIFLPNVMVFNLTILVLLTFQTWCRMDAIKITYFSLLI